MQVEVAKVSNATMAHLASLSYLLTGKITNHKIIRTDIKDLPSIYFIYPLSYYYAPPVLLVILINYYVLLLSIDQLYNNQSQNKLRFVA